MEWLLLLILNTKGKFSEYGADIHTERLKTEEECKKVGEVYLSMFKENTKKEINQAYRCIEITK